MIYATGNIPCDVKDAFWDELMNWIESGSTDLRAQDIYMLCERLACTHNAGVVTVAVDQIRGDIRFNRTFCNRFTSSEEHQALIELLKVGNTYFVLQGHPEFSVLTEDTQVSLEACVIEVMQDTGC